MPSDQGTDAVSFAHKVSAKQATFLSSFLLRQKIIEIAVAGQFKWNLNLFFFLFVFSLI